MKYIFSVFVIVLSLLVVAPVLAQEEDIEFIEFTSDDESITFAYPEDWAVLDDFISSHILVLTNNEVLFSQEDGLTPDEGDALYTVIILTDEMQSALGITLPDDITDEDLTAFAMENIIDPYYGLNGEQWAEDDIEIGEVTQVVVSEDFKLETVVFVQPNVESLKFAYRVDGTVFVVSISYFGEGILELEDVLYEIAASFEYTPVE